jgi:hypothetical protein
MLELMYDTRSQLDGLRASAAAALLAPPDSSAAESASGVGEGGASVDTVVQAVSAAVDALEAFEPSNAPEASLAAIIQRLDPCWNRLEAARTALIGTWDARQVWAADGARSGMSWMASHTEQSRGEAGARARLARSLRTMPATDAAFANGTIVGETSRGVPVTAVQAMRFTCDAHVSRVGVRSGRPASETSTDGHALDETPQGPGHAALHDRTEPLDAGLTRRLPNPSQRRALAVRDRGCTFPGCDTPTSWTSAHHLVHWINDGPTDLHNLTLLCSFHHHLVHEGGWTTSGDAAGGIEFHRPDGTAVQVPKGPAPPGLHRSPSG